MTARALVVTGFGINCQEETAAALRLAGAEVALVHISRLLAGAATLREFTVFVLPGGFSFGDDLGSGRVLANRLRLARLPSGRRLVDELADLVERGGVVLGICNGFQVLVKMGLLPFFDGCVRATLARNRSHRFEDRWVRLHACERSPGGIFGVLDGKTLPVRHGEGRLVFASPEVRARVRELGLDALHYADRAGRPTDSYPHNPNGSELACAGLVDPSGRVVGLMPHPEAAISVYNAPDWPELARRGLASDEGPGLAFFRALVQRAGGNAGDEDRSASRGGEP